MSVVADRVRLWSGFIGFLDPSRHGSQDLDSCFAVICEALCDSRAGVPVSAVVSRGGTALHLFQLWCYRVIDLDGVGPAEAALVSMSDPVVSFSVEFLEACE